MFNNRRTRSGDHIRIFSVLDCVFCIWYITWYFMVFRMVCLTIGGQGPATTSEPLISTSLTFSQNISHFQHPDFSASSFLFYFGLMINTEGQGWGIFFFSSFCLFVFLSFYLFVFLFRHHSDQMSEGSEVSKVTLCVETLKWQSLSEWVTAT